MDKRDIAKERDMFLKNVSKHVMTIRLDNGVNRDILFSREDTNNRYFGLTTWHNHLCIYGDMGTYVFSRTEDMFRFFRIKKNDFNYHEYLPIDPGYWREKLVSDATYEGSREFDREYFEEDIMERYNQFCEDEGEDLTDEDKADLLESINMQILWDLEDASMDVLYWKAHNFSSPIKDFSLDEFYGHTKATVHFIWCLHAIVWGIKQYDEFKEKKEMKNVGIY